MNEVRELVLYLFLATTGMKTRGAKRMPYWGMKFF
jgi:hypothetical protein